MKKSKLSKTLDGLLAQILLKEGITKEDLDCVDLNIAFSPVIPIKGEKPYGVVKTIGGQYLIPGHPIFHDVISKEELTIMRFRYLNSRRKVCIEILK